MSGASRKARTLRRATERALTPEEREAAEAVARLDNLERAENGPRYLFGFDPGTNMRHYTRNESSVRYLGPVMDYAHHDQLETRALARAAVIAPTPPGFVVIDEIGPTPTTTELARLLRAEKPAPPPKTALGLFVKLKPEEQG